MKLDIRHLLSQFEQLYATRHGDSHPGVCFLHEDDAQPQAIGLVRDACSSVGKEPMNRQNLSMVVSCSTSFAILRVCFRYLSRVLHNF
jgi:hypothetical protein